VCVFVFSFLCFVMLSKLFDYLLSR